MQIGPIEAQLGGLGNGQGDGMSDDRLKSVNPEYINNIWNPASNISAGSGYLQHLIDRSKGDVTEALVRYRSGGNTNSAVGGCRPSILRTESAYLGRLPLEVPERLWQGLPILAFSNHSLSQRFGVR